MRRPTCFAGLSAVLVMILGLVAGPAMAQNPVATLDAMVKGKPPAGRQVPMRVHVVGYEVDKNPRAAAQLKAVAESGGGRFSTAGIKDIDKVMVDVVSDSGGGGKQPSRKGGRLQRGETVIRHGNIKH